MGRCCAQPRKPALTLYILRTQDARAPRRALSTATLGGGGEARMTDHGSSGIVRLSTAGIPEKDRISVWRAPLGHTVSRIGLEPARGAAGEARPLAHSLPGLPSHGGV